MSSPAPSTLIIMNNSESPVVIQGIQIAPNASNTWNAASMPAVCSDINFRAGFIVGLLGVTVNGYNYTMSSFGIIDLLNQIALQSIVA
jgi:hypothetical protein